jgi:hypothetical protein
MCRAYGVLPEKPSFFSGMKKMRYWIYINSEIKGPFTKEELGGVAGYTPETLICPETPPDGKTQEWQPASVVLAAEGAPAAAAPAPLQETPAPVSEQPAPLQENFQIQQPAQIEPLPQAEPQPEIQPQLAQGDGVQLTMENAAAILGQPVDAAVEAQPRQASAQPFAMEGFPQQTDVQPSSDIAPADAAPAQEQPPVAVQQQDAQLSPAPAQDNSEITAKLDKLDQNINNIGQMLENTQRQLASPPPATQNPEMAQRIEQMMGDITTLKSEINAFKDDIQKSHSDITAKLGELSETVAGLSAAQKSQQAAAPAPMSSSMMIEPGYGSAVLPSSNAQPQQSSASMPMPSQQMGTESGIKPSEVSITMDGAPAKKGGAFKTLIKVFGILVVLVGLAAALFVVLLKQGMLPDKFNPLKKSAPEQTAPAPDADKQNAAQDAARAAQTSDQQLLAFVRSYELRPGRTLESAINDSVPQVLISSIQWNITMLRPTQYAVSIVVPASGPSSWPISYHFDYDTDKKTVTPVSSEAQTLVSAEQKVTQQPQPNAKEQDKKPAPAPAKKPKKKQITSKPPEKPVQAKPQTSASSDEEEEEIVEE